MNDDSLGSDRTMGASGYNHGQPAPPELGALSDRSIGESPTVAGSGLEFSSEQLIGSLVDGRYEIQALLGRGGMGQVFRAWDRRLQRAVALKRLLGAAIGSSASRERFAREAKAVATLSHPCIVQLFDYGDDRHGPYIVMELLEGEDLLRIIQRDGPLEVAKVLSIAEQIGAVLHHIHSNGVVHRDIKPSNVYRLPSGQAKLLDFGLVTGGEVDAQLSVAGVGMGTADYASPQQSADARTADGRDDLYSFGATLGFLLTGKAPRFLKDKDLPEAVRQPIMKLLEYRREDRYQSAEQFLAVLAQGIGAPGYSTPVDRDLNRQLGCIHCGAMNDSEVAFCTECRQPANDNCYQCGQPDKARANGCAHCGAELTKYRNALRHVDRANAKVEAREWREVFVELQAASRLHDAVPGLAMRLREVESMISDIAALKTSAQEHLLALDVGSAQEILRRLAGLLPPSDADLASMVDVGLPQAVASRKEREAQVAGLAKAAREAEACGDHDAALSHWLQAQSALADHAPAKEGVERCRGVIQRLKELWAAAKVQAAKRRMEELAATRMELQRHLPAGHAQLSRWEADVYLPLVALANRVDGIVRRASKLHGEGEWEVALGACREALVLWQDHPGTRELMDVIEEDVALFQRDILAAEQAHARGEATPMRAAFDGAAAKRPAHPQVTALRPKLAALEAVKARKAKMLMASISVVAALLVAGWYYLGVVASSESVRDFGVDLDRRTEELALQVKERRMQTAEGTLDALDERLGAGGSFDSRIEAKCRTEAAKVTPGWLPLSNMAIGLAVRGWDRSVSVQRMETASKVVEQAKADTLETLDELRAAIKKAEDRDNAAKFDRLARQLIVIDADSDKLMNAILAAQVDLQYLENQLLEKEKAAGGLGIEATPDAAGTFLKDVDVVTKKIAEFDGYPKEINFKLGDREKLSTIRIEELRKKLGAYNDKVDAFRAIKEKADADVGDLEKAYRDVESAWSSSPLLVDLNKDVQARQAAKREREASEANQAAARDREHRMEVERIVADVNRFLKQGDHDGAKSGLSALRKLNPNDTNIAAFSQRVTELGARKKEEADLVAVESGILREMTSPSSVGREAKIVMLFRDLRKLNDKHPLLAKEREALCRVLVADWATDLICDPDSRVVKDKALRQRILDAGYPWEVKHKETGLKMRLVPPEAKDDKPFYMAVNELSWHDWHFGDILGKYARPRGNDAKPADFSVDDFAYYIYNGGATGADEFRGEPDKPGPYVRYPAWLNRISFETIVRALEECQMRLPTEDEWLRASLLRSSPPESKSLEGLAWFNANRYKPDPRDPSTYIYLPTDKAKPANSLGFLNIYGNVRELLSDGRVLGGDCASQPSECLSVTPVTPRELPKMWVGVRPVRDP